LFKLPGWGRRLKVAASWTFDLFLPPELVQLRIAGSSGLAREHFEPGQDVFREGEIGDRIYFIRSGRAHVVRTRNGREEVIATLEAGAYFGEAAVLRGAPRNATVRCAIAMDTLSVAQREFHVLAAHMPEMLKTFEGKPPAAGSEAHLALPDRRA
jgi:NADH:ubiquinone reductase (H+-translocating)